MNEGVSRSARIYVAGHRGMVGSALVRCLRNSGYENLLTRTRSELDLIDPAAVQAFLRAQQPDYIFMAAAKVGGIHANNTYRADFIYQNLMLAANIIHGAHAAGVARLMFLGSSCIYPRAAPQPLREECLLSGPLELTNEPYAIAKIAGIKLCESFNRQYGTRYLCAMPTNLYGPGDNYDAENSHVLPALIRRMHEAKACGAPTVTVWGTGTPYREFLHSDDLASACIFMMERQDTALKACGGGSPLVNVGCGADLSIRELANLVAVAVGYKGKIVFDATRPDGTPRKRLDVSRLTGLGWRPRIPLIEGLAAVCAEYAAEPA